MRLAKSLWSAAASVILGLCATSAWAQQVTTYGITQSTRGSKYESPPSSGVSAGATGDDVAAAITLPFTFPYFGTNYSTIYASTNGWASFTVSANSDYGNSAFPLVDIYTSTPMYATLCPYWDDLAVGPTTYAGSMKYWTTGTAPNRHFVVSWEGVQTLSYGGAFTFQIQLYETTGSIVFAYGATGTWASGNSYTVGIEGASGQYEYPSSTGNSASNAGAPPYDFSFDNFSVTFTGQALYNRYVVDQTGIGNSQEMSLPLAGMSVEARNSAGATVGSAITDANGNYSLAAVGVPPSQTGSIVVTSAGSACAVRKTTGGALYATTLVPNISFASNQSFGTVTLSDSNDPGGAGREPINIVRTIQSVYAYAKARTAKAIPVVDPVLYDTASTATTSYTPKNAPTLASMRIGSALSGNPDPWDNSVIRKTYGRHILGAIAADPGTTYDNTFDKATDDYNAFAEGFGYYMNVIVSRDTKYFDGINSTTTNVTDMENPVLNSTRASNVAGWVTAALYDLTDPANESWDTFDGTGAAGDDVFLAAATLSAPVSASTFFTAWANKGFDATSCMRNFIHHGLIADDADEPNDYSSEATPLTQFGFVRTNRVLNQYNDDYYRFTLSYPTNVLTADCVYDRVAYASASVLLEVQTTSGGVIATGAAVGAQGAIEVKTGALATGDYVVHLKLLSGAAIPKYTLQAFSQLAFTSGSFPAWTVGRPINVPVNMTGGIPPYNLTVLSPFVKPDGLFLDGVNARVAGTPTGPQAQPIPPGGSYVYNFILSATDAAAPTANVASGPVSFTVNDALKAHFATFAAFPFGKPVDVAAPFTGGTPPYTAAVPQGALPHGLTAVGGANLRIKGTPDSPGSYSFTMTGTDVAGSADTASAVGVACVPLGQAALAAGSSACGFYFDAVKGSTVAVTVTAAKKTKASGAPRALSGTLLDKDGVTVLVPPAAKAATGKTKSPLFVAPSTGRFYFVVSSADAGGATTLTATAKIVADKSGVGQSGPDQFVAPDTFPVQVGALAGATITLTAKPDGSGLQLRGAYMIDPTGAIVLFGTSDVVEKADGSILVRKTVASSGTWTFVVGAKPGPQGQFTFTYKVKEPARAVYSAD